MDPEEAEEGAASGLGSGQAEALRSARSAASRSASATPIDLADGSGLAPFTSVVTAAGAAGAVVVMK